jgi:hypothetical protein
MEERLLQLEGKVKALQAVNGILLNIIAVTEADRKRLRDMIGRMMDRVSFSDLPGYSESEKSHLPGYSESEKSHLVEGFFGCLNEMADEIVITDRHNDSP